MQPDNHHSLQAVKFRLLRQSYALKHLSLLSLTLPLQRIHWLMFQGLCRTLTPVRTGHVPRPLHLKLRRHHPGLRC